MEGKFVDVLALVLLAEPTKRTTRGNNKQITSRELQLLDEGDTTLKLTMWGVDAEKFGSSSLERQILLMRGAKVDKMRNGTTTLSISTSGLWMVVKEDDAQPNGYREECIHLMDTFLHSKQYFESSA